jgi:hypothetical protein
VGYSLFSFQSSVNYLLVKILLLVSETAPIEWKGTFGAMTQVMITLGIMISFLFGIGIPENEIDYKPSNNTFIVRHWWRFMIGFPIILATLQTYLLIFKYPYDTPKILKKKKQFHLLNELMGKIYSHS